MSLRSDSECPDLKRQSALVRHGARGRRLRRGVRCLGLGRRFWTPVSALVVVCGLPLVLINPVQAASDNTYSDVKPEYYDNIEDRPGGEVFDSVNRLRGLGIFEGTDCAKNKFCPNDLVDRKTFAVWMVRILDGNDAPDFVETRGVGTGIPHFEDAPTTYPENKFIERLAELEITNGCSLEPARYCPDGTIPRGQLATFISKALDLPESEPVGFWDVEKKNKHLDNINKLVISEIDDGCSEVRFVPFHFCPNQLVSRGDMAKMLSEVIDYIDASEIIRVNENSKPNNSVGLSASYDEATGVTTTTWADPDNNSGGISNYVLQWRPSWGDFFNYRRYQVVETNGSGRYEFKFTPPIIGSEIYAVRVITTYDDGDRLATYEVRVPSKSHNLRDLIKTQVVDVYGSEQPWLIDTWRHLNGPVLDLIEEEKNQVTRTGVGGYTNGSLKQTLAGTLSLSHRQVDDFDRQLEKGGRIISHELGHVYTLTSGISENKAPLAVGHLYLKTLAQNHAPGKCSSWELYADLAVLAFQGTYSQFNPDSLIYGGHYWDRCGFNFDQNTKNKVVREVADIIESVFLDQEIPQWFYDEYQRNDKSIGLDSLWSDVKEYGAGSTSFIVYGLQDEFGGYCSKEEVRQFVVREVDSIDTPWRDAVNCQTTNPEPQTSPEEPEPQAKNKSPDCTGNIPIIVASDSASQPDRYSAVTLAGVLGTDCIILAGGRHQPMPAEQLSRLNSASPRGYIVGGTAAVPNSKVTGYNLKRLAGEDRWHTARLVGAEALIIAGGNNTGSVTASAGAEDPTTDCTGDTPIVVASDATSQSDRYSAVTLAGVLGTDCVVLAGGRDQPMPAEQMARLNAAASPGYIVGGIAAVPSAKVSGYDLKRLAGTDRWHTARLVGDEARRIAGGGAP